MQRIVEKDRELRRLRREVERSDRRRKWGNRVSVFLLVISVVLLGIFVQRVAPVHVDGGTSTEPTSISFTRSQIQWLDENYNYSVENGFCLFGHREESQVVVEQVEYVDNPARQSKWAMSFTCIPQILARSENLLLREDYELVGAVHTHPRTKTLSGVDRDTFRFFDPVLSVFGVYNNGSLKMYSSPGQEEALTNVLRFS
mgnify:CR=1 FL=1